MEKARIGDSQRYYKSKFKRRNGEKKSANIFALKANLAAIEASNLK